MGPASFNQQPLNNETDHGVLAQIKLSPLFEQVQAALKAVGGTVLPIPDIKIFSLPSDKDDEPQLEIWDADVLLS
jgi:hypothetical protein